MFEAVGMFFALHPHLFMALMGAGTGFASAAKTDFDAFKSFKSVEEFASYSWKLAAWRWLQGAFIGAVTASPFGKFVAF